MIAYIVPSTPGAVQVFAFVSHRGPAWTGWIKHCAIYPFFKAVLAQDRKILALQQQCIEASGGERFTVCEQDLMRPHIVDLLNGEDLSGRAAVETTLYL